MNPQEQLDPSIIALTKAIGHQESAGKYDLVGDNGHSKGAYQWNNPTPLKEGEVPENFKGFAKDVGANGDDFSPENQDRVAYKTVEKWGKQGLTPAQIASKWNSGGPDTYKTAKPGYNAEQGVNYDVKSYVDNVAKNYERFNQPQQQQGGYNPKPFSTGAGAFDYSGNAPITETPTTNTDTLGGQLLHRTEDIGTAIKDTMAGKQNIVSGVLQTAGGIAGGIGDVAGKALELIPGMKWLEKQIGTGVGKLAQTEAGQSVAKSIQKFSTEHPELSKDIGAGFNIVTAIPILKGLGVVKNIATDATAQALKGVAGKAWVSSGPGIIGNTKAAQKLLAKNSNVFQDALDRGLIGDIKGINYITKDDINRSWKTIKNNNLEVKKIISDPKFATIGEDGNKIAMDALKNSPQSGMIPSEMIANARKLDGSNKLLWDKFEAGQANLAEINELRSSLDGKVKKAFIQGASLDTPEIALSKELGADLSNSMRAFVQNVAPETQPYFKEMATQFDIQKMLELMNNKPIKPGTIAGVTGDIIGTGVGGTIGATIGGTPGAVIGGLAGQRTGGTIARKLAGQNITQGILKRTGKNAVRTSKKAAIKRVGGLIGGVSAQKLNP